MAAPNEAICRPWDKAKDGERCPVCNYPYVAGQRVIEIPGQEGASCHEHPCFYALLENMQQQQEGGAFDPAYTNPAVTDIYAITGEKNNNEGLIAVGIPPIPCVASDRKVIAKAVRDMKGRVPEGVKVKVWQFSMRTDVSKEFGL